MPVNLSIKNAPDDVVERLRQRAKRHHRSLQGELMAIIEEASADSSPVQKPKLTIEKLAADNGNLGLSRQNEAARMIREDRDNR
jgi:plasmid stability protein